MNQSQTEITKVCSEMNIHHNLARQCLGQKDFKGAVAHYDVCIAAVTKIINSKVAIENRAECSNMLSIFYSYKADVVIILKNEHEALNLFHLAMKQWPCNIHAACGLAFAYRNSDRKQSKMYASIVIDEEVNKAYMPHALPEDHDAAKVCHMLLAVFAHTENNHASFALHSKHADTYELAKYFYDSNNFEEAKKFAILTLKNKSRRLDPREIAFLKVIWARAIHFENLGNSIYMGHALSPQEIPIVELDILKSDGQRISFPELPLTFPITEKKEPPRSCSLVQLQLAVRLLEEAEELGSQDALSFLYSIFSDRRSPLCDYKKAIQYLKKWADTGSNSGLLHLCANYFQNKEDCEKNIEFILQATETIEKNIKDLSKMSCSKVPDKYIERDRRNLSALLMAIATFYFNAGDEISDNLGIKYLERSSRYSSDHKYQLAQRYLIKGFQGDQLAMHKAILYLKQLAKAHVFTADMLLGVIYLTPGGFQDINKAEHHLRIGYSNGIAECGHYLYSHYTEQLCHYTNTDDPQYLSISSAVVELESEIKDTEFLKSVNHFHKDLYQANFAELFKASKIYRLDCPPSVKLYQILDESSQFSGAISLCSSLHRIGNLLEPCRHDEGIFETMQTKMQQLLIHGKALLASTSFPLLSLCLAIQGVSRIYSHGYKQYMDDFIKTYVRHIIKQKFTVNLFHFNMLLSAFIRLPLHTNFLANELGILIKQFLSQSEKIIENNEDISGILYHFAVLANLNKINPEFKMRKFRINELLPLITYAVTKLSDETISSIDRNQYFLASLYFYNHYPRLGSIGWDKLIAYKEQFSIEESRINTSYLQTIVYERVKSFYPAAKKEYLINTVPVDIFIPNGNIVIQVDGPKHRYYIGESPDAYQQRPKDPFHDCIINCKFFDGEKNERNSFEYTIIHVRHDQIEEKNFSKLNEILKKEGLTLNYWQNSDLDIKGEDAGLAGHLTKVGVFKLPQNPSSTNRSTNSDNTKGKKKEPPFGLHYNH